MESDEAEAAASGGTVTPVPKKRGRKPKSKDDSEAQTQSGGKVKESGKKTKQEQSVEETYSQWKGLVPILYDWLANHNLVWLSLSCRWGPQLDQATYKNRQRLYLSEQTDGSVPNTLVIANCEVVKPRVAAAEHISQFNEEARSPFVKKIRELPQNSKIVATHTDTPDVLIWDVETQPNRHAVLGVANSLPDLILTGHQDNAEFALAMCPTEPFVLSGGKDKLVVLWSIQDHITTVGTDSKSSGSIIKQTGESGDKTGVLLAQEFCSVGDDSCLILWDARTGTTPVTKVEKAHDADLHCVDWNPHDDNLILTGSADNTWSPDKASVFGSSAEDGLLNIWDYDRVSKMSDRAAKNPAGLFFQHAGHRDKVVDFHWNAADPWTIVSVSDDCETTAGGGTLQIWRMSDLIYRPEEEVLTELEKFKSHVMTCASKP
ncbi:hypothetical protein N665_0383s0192 [Sinapis alba]|nr:hypothetical protein N665_0383s0192 [Sinapis alba]